MRFSAVSLVIVSLISVLGASTASAEIPWQTNLRTAHAEAQKDGKLMLLHFYSDNCVWCERLETTSFASDDVAKAITAGFVPVKIHAGQNPKITEMFKVTKFPTDVIVTPSGNTVGHQVSPQDPQRYVSMLGKAAATKTQPAPSKPAASTPMVAADDTPKAESNPAAAAKPADTNPVAAKPVSAKLNRDTTPAAPSVTRRDPELAMQGFCPVTVIKEDRWVEGNPKLGVVHLGRLYLFSNANAMQTFLADPMPYTPVLNGIDVVRFFEEKKIVHGKREWGMKDPTHNRMFFFADEAAMNHFWNEYERYTGAALDVMDKAVKDANPGS